MFKPRMKADIQEWTSGHLKRTKVKEEEKKEGKKERKPRSRSRRRNRKTKADQEFQTKPMASIGGL